MRQTGHYRVSTVYAFFDKKHIRDFPTVSYALKLSYKENKVVGSEKSVDSYQWCTKISSILRILVLIGSFVGQPTLFNTGCAKKVHKFKIIYLCSENRQITNFCVIC